MNGQIPIVGTYDYRLVALSVVIAIFSSYAALDLAGRVTANRGRARFGWLMGGALAMGCGIWAMHYTGMLAYRLPIRVYYHVPTVIASLLAAVLASLTALYVVSRERITPLAIACGSVLMGAGIATMHYTGMAAMRMAAMHRYHGGLWTLSVVIAVVISLIGLLLISYYRDESRSGGPKAAVALILGLAIPVMHYTGMTAVSFVSTASAPDLSRSVDISALASLAILVITGVILAFVVATSLVDRRLSAQQSILDEERKMLRALIDNIPHFMYVKDRQGRFVIANSHTAHVLGVGGVEDLLGKTDFDFFPKELAEAFHNDEQKVMRSGRPLFDREEATVDRQGNTTHILTTKVPLRGPNGQVSGIAGVGRDISRWKRSEDAVREAERKYREIFDEAIIGIFQSTPDRRFLSVNRTMARIFGFASGEEMLAGVTDIARQIYVEPKCYHEFAMVMDRLGSVLSLECEAYRKDGSKVWIACSGRAVYEHRMVVRYEGMIEDITERKHLRGQLLQAQKLESIGQLAAGIAHEINSPTQYIGDNLRFLRDAFQDLQLLIPSNQPQVAEAATGDASPATPEKVERTNTAYLLEEIPKALEQAIEGVTRVSTIVGAMKEFSHPGTKEKIPLDLNRSISSTITVARHEWKYVADLDTEFDRSLPPIPCQPGEFNQVVLNLIVNAAHAIADVLGEGSPQKGKITVETRNCPAWAEIRIRDTGTGIPEKVRGQVFDPFFTTKEIGKGTGQGLAIAHSVIVDKHNGSIHFETEEGKGTTFIIRLPKDGMALAAKAGAS
jgi:PAS domain S-box-containing protein